MITFPRTGRERCPNLLADTGKCLRFDQSRRRCSGGLLYRHQLDEDRRFLLPLLYHLLDASRLPFDAGEPLGEVASFMLVHAPVPFREDPVAHPSRDWAPYVV